MKKFILALLFVPSFALAQSCPGGLNWNGLCVNNPQGSTVMTGQQGTGPGGKGQSITLAPGAPSSASNVVGDFSVAMDPTNPASGFKCSNTVGGTAACTLNGSAIGTPTIPTATVLGNNSGSTAPASALNPLALINMQNAVFAVDVVAVANITLSGTFTVDGLALSVGNIVLAAGQTISIQNGVWIVQSGAWTRPVNFPSGYVIPALCDLSVLPLHGTTQAGIHWRLNLGSAVTIDTTAQSWVKISFGSGSGFALVTPTPTVGDCVSWSGVASIEEGIDANSQHGNCALTNNSTGHVILSNNGGLFIPSVSVGTLNANSTDQWGQITGLTSASSITLTFSAPWPNNVVACMASDSVASAIGITYTSSAGTITAAVFAPAAALTGSMSYHCLGTN